MLSAVVSFASADGDGVGEGLPNVAHVTDDPAASSADACVVVEAFPSSSASSPPQRLVTGSGYGSEKVTVSVDPERSRLDCLFFRMFAVFYVIMQKLAPCALATVLIVRGIQF